MDKVRFILTTENIFHSSFKVFRREQLQVAPESDFLFGAQYDAGFCRMKRTFFALSLFFLALVFLAAFALYPVHASIDESSQTESENYYIDFEEALRLALTDVVSLIDLYVGIENLEATLYNQREALRAFVREHGDHEGTRDTISSKRREITESERQIRNAEYQQEIVRLSRENSLRNALSQIAGIERNIVRTEASLEIMDESLRRTEVLHVHGRISRQSLESARQGLQNARNELRSYELQLQTEKGNLNRLLGKTPTQNTVVVFEIGVRIEISDFEAHMYESIQNAPSIRQLEIVVERMAEQVRIEEARVGEIIREMPWLERHQIERLSEELSTRRIAHERAKLVYEQAKASMETQLRQSWRSFENLRNQEASAVSALEAASSNLETVLAEHGLGRNTPLDIMRAEFSVLTARQRVETVMMQLWMLEFVFLNPVLL